MNVSIRQLRYIRTNGACRSISRAAKELQISPSSIGAAIDHVENEFGLRIFIRQPSKGLTVTLLGRGLLQFVGGLLAQVEDFASHASGMKNVAQLSTAVPAVDAEPVNDFETRSIAIY